MDLCFTISFTSKLVHTCNSALQTWSSFIAILSPSFKACSKPVKKGCLNVNFKETLTIFSRKFAKEVQIFIFNFSEWGRHCKPLYCSWKRRTHSLIKPRTFEAWYCWLKFLANLQLEMKFSLMKLEVLESLKLSSKLSKVSYLDIKTAKS